MSDLLHIVKGLSAQPKCVLVLGARTEAMLNWLFSLTATQVVLVEPEPAMYEKASVLHSAKGKPDNVTIIHGAPVFESEQKTTAFFASSVLGFSSVLPPNVIKSIRPALVFTEQQVPIIALKPLLKQFEISEGRPCMLISQLNGAEQQCLNTQILSAFTHVVIQSSLKPIFGKNKPVEKLKKELTECGRDYLELAESMPPYSNFVATKKVNAEQALNYFSRRQQHREIKAELENKLSASHVEAKKITEELQHAKQQVQTAEKQAEFQLAKLKTQLTKVQEQYASEKEVLQSQIVELGKKHEETSSQLVQKSQGLSELTDEKLKLNSELEQIRKKFAVQEKDRNAYKEHALAEINQLKSQLEQSQESLAKEKMQQEALQVQTSQLKQDSASLLKRAKHTEAEFTQQKEKLAEQLVKLKQESDQKIAENRNWAESLQKQLEQVKSELSEKIRSANFGQKILVKTQVDLDDLRNKYSEKVESEKELLELVRELREKLTLASKYYFKLQQEHPELLSANSDDKEALS